MAKSWLGLEGDPTSFVLVQTVRRIFIGIKKKLARAAEYKFTYHSSPRATRLGVNGPLVLDAYSRDSCVSI